MLALLVTPASAQPEYEDDSCDMDTVAPPSSALGPIGLPAPKGYIPTTGSIRALVVFVQASGDDYRSCVNVDKLKLRNQGGNPTGVAVPWDTFCNSESPPYESVTEDPATEWPAYDSNGDRVLPQWASRFIDPPGTPPASYQEGSISQFYYEMSMGQLRYEGVVYPEVVETSVSDLLTHDPPDVRLGDSLSVAAAEVIDHLNANPMGIDFRQFDRYINGTGMYSEDADNDGEPDGDGEVDQLILVGRRAGAIACFGSNYRSCPSGETSDGFSEEKYLVTGQDSIRVRDNLRYGGGYWTTGYTLDRSVKVAAHEVGHIMMYDHNCSTDSISIMCGPHRRALSASDRAVLGWLNPTSVQASSLSETPFTLSADPFDGEALWIHGPGGSANSPAPGDVLVEARTFASTWDGPPVMSDGDYEDIGAPFPHEGLAVYQRSSSSDARVSFYSLQNTGRTSRIVSDGEIRGLVLIGEDPPHLGYTVGDALTPLSRMNFSSVYDGSLNDGVAITDVNPATTTVSFDAWGDFLVANKTRTVETNYTIADHNSSPGYGRERNWARTDDWTFGGTLRLGGALGQVQAGSPTIDLLTNGSLEAVGDITLQGPTGYTLPVTAGQKANVVAHGTLTAQDVPFTASDPSQGWDGVRFEPGSDGDLDNVTIERVGDVGTYVLRIYDASPKISGSVIQDPTPGALGSGVYVSGSLAEPVIEDSQFLTLSYDGIVVSGGAKAQLIENTVTGVDRHALVVLGYDSEAFVSPHPGNDEGNQLILNDGHGVYSSAGGDVYMGYFYYPSGPIDAMGFNSITGNEGRGLFANSAGFIGAGNASAHQRNRIFGNTVEDARAKGSGTSIPARCDWWNDTTPPFRTSSPNGGYLDDSYFLTADPYVDPAAPCVTGSGGSLRVERGTGETAAKGETSDLPADRLATLSATAHEDPEGALTDLALLADEHPEIAAAALAEVARIAARRDAARSTRALGRTLLGTRLAAHRASAQRGLLRILGADGDSDGALALAAALAASPDEDDRMLGYVSRVHLLAATGRVVEAEAALAALEAESPESVEAGILRSDLVARGGHPAARPEVETAGSLKTGADAGTTMLGAVYPNPAVGVAVVPLVLAEAATVRIVVYDVLGREIAVAADRPMEAGRHAVTLAGHGWAPGVYLVRAQVTTEDGATQNLVRRFTLARC